MHTNTESHLLYLVECVDVDLSLLVSFCAHEHRSSNQEEIRVGVAVHIDSLQDAAEVGTNLRTSQNHLSVDPLSNDLQKHTFSSASDFYRMDPEQCHWEIYAHAVG